MTHELTPAQRELLYCLIGECNEVSNIATKILRFGLFDVNPNEPNGGTNQERLENELGHIQAAVRLLHDYDVLDARQTRHHCDTKLMTIQKWLKHATVRIEP